MLPLKLSLIFSTRTRTANSPVSSGRTVRPVWVTTDNKPNGYRHALRVCKSQISLTRFEGSEFTTWKEFSKRGVEISLPKTGNHAQLFATSGMDNSATKEQVTTYISKLMVQFLIEYEDNNGNFQSDRLHSDYAIDNGP